MLAGLERLPLAFRPFLGNRVKFGRRIEKAQYLAGENKIKFLWREDFKQKTFKEEIFDYALVAVPFTQVRRWRLPSEYPGSITSYSKILADRMLVFSDLLKRAIVKLGYDTACKASPTPSSALILGKDQDKRINGVAQVSLQFKTRFWEHLDKPIFGGCASTDIPGTLETITLA